jgi:hypothetical protein
MKNCLHWTRPNGGAIFFTIWPETPGRTEGYELVTSCSDQNRLRNKLSILHDVKIAGTPSYCNHADLMVTVHDGDYRLWVRSALAGWKGYGAFLSGIIVGNSWRWDRIQRKLARRKKRRVSKKLWRESLKKLNRTAAIIERLNTTPIE